MGRKLIAAFMLIFIVPALSFAHPHLFMFTRLELVFDSYSCTGIEVEWMFDRFFSSSIIQDYDLNRDGRFNAEETGQVHDNAFINLKNYDFFISLRKNDARYRPQKVENFSLRQKEGIVFYKFPTKPFPSWSKSS